MTNTRTRCRPAAAIPALMAAALGYTTSSPAELITTLTLDGATVGAEGNTVRYGDGLSFSLPILQFRHEQAFGMVSDNPFKVESTPGAIADELVVATGTTGMPVNDNSPATADDAYRTPDGAGSPPTFATGATLPSFATFSAEDDPGPAIFAPEFIGDGAGSWDVRVDDLLTFLDDGLLTFFFNNNQTNSGEAEDQNLLAYMQIKLGRDALPDMMYFDLVNDPPPPADMQGDQGDPIFPFEDAAAAVAGYDSPSNTSGDFAADVAEMDMVLSRGQVCLDGGTFGAPIIPCGSGDPDEVFFNQNLGADEAAFAIRFPELDMELRRTLDLGGGVEVPFWDFLQINLVLGDLNNGFEQLFIMSTESVPGDNGNGGAVPAPATLGLMGVGLLLVSLRGRAARRT